MITPQTTITKDKNDIIHLGDDVFLEISTLHAVVKEGMILKLYFCSCNMSITCQTEEDASKTYLYLKNEKENYIYRCNLSKEANEKRQSYAIETQAEMLKEMKR